MNLALDTSKTALSKTALVVDDSGVQRQILSLLLKEEGFEVVTAEDGAQGVNMYLKYQPDLILMDINMPVMNGYEAAKKIKEHSGHLSLCPLIFVTTENTDAAYVKAIEAGGDSILVRPFPPEVFKAKVKSIQRISDLYRQVKQLQQEQEADVAIAEKLMSEVIEARNFGRERIGVIKRAADVFSGDVQLMAVCPNGDVNVLMGDFTGHGLRSSIGAVPLSETFRAMTRKGFSLIDIVSQINSQLYELLPADLFLAAAFARVSSHEKTVYLINAGLPDAYIFSASGMIKRKITSCHPPIGVLPRLLPDTQTTVAHVSMSDHLVLISDGIVEARNSEGEMYEFERFEDAAFNGVIEGDIAGSVSDSVNKFCGDMPQEDDISLIDIPCGGWKQGLVNPIALKEGDTEEVIDVYNDSLSAWEWNFSLKGERLARVNPIPMIMNQINEIEGPDDHWLNVYTILTELFVNALDHGVLELDSSIKSGPEGFSLYFTEREKRLKNLITGSVDISLNYHPVSNGGRLIIRIKDSGNGFDLKNHYVKKSEEVEGEPKLSGRGIELVEQLSDSLEFLDGGSLVEAVYIWRAS